MNKQLKARITEANLGIIDINGFKYNLHLADVETQKGFKVLLPIFNDVMVGDCFETEQWTVTHLGSVADKPIDLCLRVDKFTLSTTPEFQLSKYLNANVVGIFLNSDKCFLRTIGPEKKPFYSATIKIKDEYNAGFPIYIVGFGSVAKKLSTIKKGSIIECEVTIKKSKDSSGYEFAVSSVNVISEENKR